MVDAIVRMPESASGKPAHLPLGRSKFNRKSLARSVVVGGACWARSTSHAQIPAPTPEKPPVRVQLKPAAAPGQPDAGPLGVLGVALEIQAQQENIPAGLRGTVVVTNSGTEPVEFLDPRDSSQREIQTADGNRCARA